jgi:hypothetical protein
MSSEMTVALSPKAARVEAARKAGATWIGIGALENTGPEKKADPPA